MKNDKETYYRQKRDINLENRPLAAFYQILIVQEAERSKFSFHKKNTLKQLQQILNEMLEEILEIDDSDYQKGIYLEVFLAGRNYCLSDGECQICSKYFEKSRVQEYVQGAYQIHLCGIKDIAQDDVEAARLYADNLLKILRIRYGEKSLQYAKMKLHIIGECLYWNNREQFLCTFRENYDYFKQYTMRYDFFFFIVLSDFVYLLEESEDKDYDLWMMRFEKDIEQTQGDELYCFFQCKIAWIKAKVFEKKKQNEEGLKILQKAIRKYLYMDSNRTRPFYAYVYLSAAYFSMTMMEYEKMFYYAQEGLEICQKINQIGSEVYFNLYNYIGVWYMREQNWGRAEKLYGSMIPEIIRRFGKENENYVIYMSNLAVTAINRGKDATSYFNEIKRISSNELQKKFRILMNNELNYSIARGDFIDETRAIYKKCILNVEDDRAERERLDTLYTVARINEQLFDEKTEILLKSLEKNYENKLTGELPILYWSSRVIWEWKNGKLQEALKIAENLIQGMRISEYVKNILVVMNDIQLLIIHGQYENAKKKIFPMLNTLDKEVLKIGCGNPWVYFFYIRILLSMYIQVLKKDGMELRIEGEEAKELLEKIMRYKTLEREIKGVIGKYDEDQMDLYYFKLAHRKLVALETAYNERNLEQADYDRRKMNCLIELEQYESSISQRLPLGDLIRTYNFEDIKVPHKAICAEYFAYYNFLTDGPMFKAEPKDNENEVFSYLVFILGEERGETKILEIMDIPCEKKVGEEFYCLFDAVKNKKDFEEDEIEQIRMHLNQKFAVPVLKYAIGKDRLYLGMDYELQMLPTDLIFCEENGEPINSILLDSVCYIENDTEIDMRRSGALIIGNPKLNLHGEQKEPVLPCGELECIKIAEMFGTKAYIREAASQKVLWGREPKDVIHISTHGVHKTPNDMMKFFRGDPCIYSYLKFAGYEDWKEGRKEKGYGNGIVSGEDFLFMDLSKTKLIVLSACVSGLGYSRGLDTLHGMRWAISAAGADNSITTLWEVSEEATAVLMLLFYRNLHMMPIGDALHCAKKRLRMLTVSELRKDKDLHQIIEVAQNSVANNKGYNVSESDRPFSHWKYWAGFICYHR